MAIAAEAALVGVKAVDIPVRLFGSPTIPCAKVELSTFVDSWYKQSVKNESPFGGNYQVVNEFSKACKGYEMVPTCLKSALVNGRCNPDKLSGAQINEVVNQGLCAVQPDQYEEIVIMILVVGVFFISAAIHSEFFTVLLSSPAYFVMLPTTINVIMTYAFANLHDVSWGNRETSVAKSLVGTEAASVKQLFANKKAKRTQAAAERLHKAKRQQSFFMFRTQMLMFWILVNIFWVSLVLSGYLGPPACFLTGLAVVVAVYNGLRLIGSTINMVKISISKCCRSCSRKKKATRQDSLADPLLNDAQELKQGAASEEAARTIGILRRSLNETEAQLQDANTLLRKQKEAAKAILAV